MTFQLKNKKQEKRKQKRPDAKMIIKFQRKKKLYDSLEIKINNHKSTRKTLIKVNEIEKEIKKVKTDIKSADVDIKELRTGLEKAQKEKAHLCSQTTKWQLDMKKLESEVTKLKKEKTAKENLVEFMSEKAKPSQAEKTELIMLSPEFKPCGIILKKLRKRDYHQFFEKPVDIDKYKDYFQVVARPMCFQKVSDKLYGEVYFNTEEFARDMKQIWMNAMNYNPPSHLVYQFATEFEIMFDRYYSQIKPKLEKKIDKAELVELREKMLDLPPESLQKITEVIEGYDNHKENEQCVDLDVLPSHVIRQLQKIVEYSLRGESKKNWRREQRQRLKKQISHLEDLNKSGAASTFGLPPPC